MIIFYRGVKLSNPILAHHGAGISKPTKLPKSPKNHPVKCNFLYTSTMVSFYMEKYLWDPIKTLAIGISSKQAFEHCSLLAKHAYLVGALEHDFYDFPYIGNVIIPTDELIFFGGGETTNQLFSELGTSYIHASWFILFHVGLNI